MAQQPQVYPNTKIITLLESNSEQLGNGAFNINLDEQVILKEGDTIELDKVFVDTTPSEETFITITPEESEITIKHGMYLTDVLPNDTSPDAKPIWGNWSQALGNRPDGKKYILQNEEPSFNDTFLDWNQTINPFITQTPIPIPFKTELTALVPEDNNGFEYFVTALLPSPPPTPINPPNPGVVLDTQYYMHGHCRLIATGSTNIFIGPFEFYYYHRDYLPPAGVFGDNDHIAVIQRWTTGTGAIQGWKIKANPLTTETREAYKWTFQSDSEGYNYFNNGGNPHMIEITEVAMVIDTNFSPRLFGTKIDNSYPTYPGYEVSWYDPRTQKTYNFTKIFNASKYDPVINTKTNPPVIIGGGMIELLDVIPDSALIKYDNRVDKDANPPLNLPKDAKLGWGRGNGFEFYRLKQFTDPYSVDSLVTLPKMTISIDHMPEIKFYWFRDGKPGGTGFINETAVGWYSPEKQAMIMNSVQILGQNPMRNSVTGGRTMLPREYTTTFTIPPGDYSNGDLAQLLTDKINANTSPVVGLSNNPGAEIPVFNAAGYSSSYFLQTTYELMEQADGYSAAASLPANLTRYPNDYAYSPVTIPPRTLADGTTLAQIPLTTASNVGTQPYFLSEDGEQLFQFVADAVQPLGTTANVKAHNVGASEVSILFDETEQAFTIAQAHTNIVGGTDKIPIDPVIQLIRALPDNDKSFFGNQIACDTYSGIFFTDLQPRSLWFEKMGLNQNMLTTVGAVNSQIKDFSTALTSSFNGLPTAGDVSSVLCHPTILTKSINITGLFNGVDNIIVKAPFATGQNPGDIPDSNFAVQPQIFSELVDTSTLVSLVGESKVNAVEDDPYFQIEISGINNQNIVGQPTKNSLVQGIVGKFYSNGNFTQDEDSGYAYTHKGEPLIIRQLAVRILDSTGKPEEGLGPKSAVILKISTDK